MDPLKYMWKKARLGGGVKLRTIVEEITEMTEDEKGTTDFNGSQKSWKEIERKEKKKKKNVHWKFVNE